MSGQLSASLRGFRGSTPIENRTVLYYNPDCEMNWTPYQTSKGFMASETSGKARTQYEVDLQSFKTPERKPDPFFVQQNKILTFIPPIFNDTYTLDVQDVSINKNGMPSQSDYIHDQYINLRDSNLIPTGIPMAYSDGKQYQIYALNKPDVEIYETKLNTSGTTTKKLQNVGYSQNRCAELPIPQAVDYQIRKPTATLPAGNVFKAQKIELNENIIYPEPPKVRSKFPLYHCIL
jgi:hypothetical protein